MVEWKEARDAQGADKKQLSVSVAPVGGSRCWYMR